MKGRRWRRGREGRGEKGVGCEERYEGGKGRREQGAREG